MTKKQAQAVIKAWELHVPHIAAEARARVERRANPMLDLISKITGMRGSA